MKKYLLLLIPVLLLGTVAQGQQKFPRQDVHRVDMHDPGVVCPASKEVKHTYVPPLINDRSERSGTPLQVEVTYDPNVNFPRELKRSLEEDALPLLSQWFSSDVPVRAFITGNNAGGGTLASAGPAEYRRFVSAAPCADCWYPIPLVEKMIGQNINGDNPDLFINVNLGQEWYYDGLNNESGIGNDQYDFATVILHELFHGLGLVSFGTFVNDGGVGRIRVNGSPSIYASLLEDQVGNPLLDLDDNTTNLGDALTSNEVFFNGESFQNSTVKLRIFAPRPFRSGSSISHLDETTYQLFNQLMTPSVGRAEIVLNPGQSQQLMNDLGWTSTSIVYLSGQGGPEEKSPDEPLEVTVRVRSDEEVDLNTLQVTYSADGFLTSETLNLVSDGPSGTFSATIPAPGEAVTYEFFFELQTESDKRVTAPGSSLEGQQAYFEFQYGFDEDAPLVEHEPQEVINSIDPAVGISATVTDEFTGVDSVWVVYGLNDAPEDSLVMEPDETISFVENAYFASIPLPDIKEGDTLSYRITAVDRSVNKNRVVFPADAPFRVPVEDLLSAVVTYVNDFDTGTTDFKGDFFIQQPDGFASQAIHTEHPYPESGSGNVRNYTYELTVPIQLDENDGLITFDEIVLVEPGEAGSEFGDEDFWDYVAVEAKKVGTNEWIPLATPYDSRDNSTWLSTYNSSIEGNNSTAVGTPDLYRRRTVDILSVRDFVDEDILLVRFRLYSDPFAAGWGWAIDNLEIQNGAATIVRPVLSEEASLQVYPNPVGAGALQAQLNFTGESKAVRWQLFDPMGRLLQNAPLAAFGSELRFQVDMNDLPAGLYLLRVEMDDGSLLRQRILKNQ